MSDDEPPDNNVTQFPIESRRRPRMPDLPAAKGITGVLREELANWMRVQFEDIERRNAERVELLRTVGEHPSPVFANIVRQEGSLGMPKSLVARKLGITTYSLELNYGAEYELGKSEMIREVAANAIRIATSVTDPNAAATAIKILDRMGGDEWKPPAQKVEMKTEEAGPPIIDSSKLTMEERAQMRAMLERIDAEEQSGGDAAEDETTEEERVDG
jgi:hypothetical protein